MNHSFIASQIDTTKCARCHYNEVAHGNEAICEVCGSQGSMNIAFGMLLCDKCEETERDLQKQHREQESNRVIDYNKSVADRLSEIKSQDEGIQLRSDMFNAKIASIQEIKDTINKLEITDEDKMFMLAKTLKDRHEHLTNVIFKRKQQLDEAGNEQRAIQVELNLLANKLRAEEREKLKIADINYKPVAPKLSKPRAPKTAKFDKNEVKRVAAELAQYGFTEFNVQSVVVSRKVTPEEAGQILKNSIGV